MDYKKLYLTLFNAATDALEDIQRAESLLSAAGARLRGAQSAAEELYIEETAKEEDADGACPAQE